MARGEGSDEARPPSRRHSGRPDVVTYRVRVELKETTPPLWRRLELASDLCLDEVHEIIQAAFGWTDSHLHRFGSGPDYYSPDTEYYLCPFEVEEGGTGIPEDQVRLDEVLSDVGGRLFYGYDFGDDWQHVVMLEAVIPRAESAPRATCTAGRRPGPAEDCGGVYGYELITAATDPDHLDHAEAVAEFARLYGDDVSPLAFDIVPLDMDEINGAITALGIDDARSRASIPEPLEKLVGAVRTTADRRQLRRLIGDAWQEPADLGTETAARMVRPYTWLLDRVGAGGVTLTGAGYLPPAQVAAAMAELGLGEEWIGKGNREIQTLPVLHLRESATKMGLLRKHRGKLVLTPRGRAAATDPLALWWQLAERMPPRSADACETQAGLILLVAVAAQSADDLDATIARFLDAIGWTSGDGTPLTGSMAARAAWDTKTVLRRVGAFGDDARAYGPARPTGDGVAFARAALRTWPDSPRSAGAT
jgi:Plasmid pRiA4b ORF-3-like protein